MLLTVVFLLDFVVFYLAVTIRLLLLINKVEAVRSSIEDLICLIESMEARALNETVIAIAILHAEVILYRFIEELSFGIIHAVVRMN